MDGSKLMVVTGALSYTGQYITRILLNKGYQVRTITGHVNRPNPFGDDLEVAPLDFTNPEELIQNLKGADTLFNTYWIRFSHGETTFEKAVENSKILIDCAVKAGVRKIVHVSITKNSEDSPLPYFKGKALVEKAILNSGLSYAIIRPTVIYGNEDILINNIAFFLRKFPLFAIPGLGKYKVQPIFVEDYANIAVEYGLKDENYVIDAVGPEILTFDQLVKVIRYKLGCNTLIIYLNPFMTWIITQIFGWWFKDVTLTWDEIKGLTGNLLYSDDPPLGRTKLSEWISKNAKTVGTKYTSELEKHYR